MTKAEEWQIRRFLELLSGAPQGTLEFPDPPDAVVRTVDTCVAIEHTRVIRPRTPESNLRAYERRTDVIAAKAQAAFEAARSDALHVTLYFDDQIRLAKSDEDKVAMVT